MPEERNVGIDRLTLVAGPDQALEVVGEAGVWFRLLKSGIGYKVEAPATGLVYRLVSHDAEWRLVIEDDPETEQVLWSLRPGDAAGIAGSSLLHQDGSLYLIQDRPGAAPAYDLCGWQTPWPYFTACLEGGSQIVQVHPSGATLIQEGQGIDLLILFTAAVSGIRTGSASLEEESS